jgi:hypothetical protein
VTLALTVKPVVNPDEDVIEVYGLQAMNNVDQDNRFFLTSLLDLLNYDDTMIYIILRNKEL